MLKVKICGLTNLEDALLASQLGVDALGFNFYSKSPRYIHPKEVRRIVLTLPPFVTTVGVFVNQETQEVREIMQQCGLNVAQLHGDESPEQCRELSCKVIKAFRVKDEKDLETLMSYKDYVTAFLLDTKLEGYYGGTGRTFPWELARKVEHLGHIILAGGLTPENVKRAVEKTHPYAIDLSSGVEISPGRKDRKRIAALMEKIREVTYAT